MTYDHRCTKLDRLSWALASYLLLHVFLWTFQLTTVFGEPNLPPQFCPRIYLGVAVLYLIFGYLGPLRLERIPFIGPFKKLLKALQLYVSYYVINRITERHKILDSMALLASSILAMYCVSLACLLMDGDDFHFTLTILHIAGHIAFGPNSFKYAGFLFIVYAWALLSFQSYLKKYCKLIRRGLDEQGLGGGGGGNGRGGRGWNNGGRGNGSRVGRGGRGNRGGGGRGGRGNGRGGGRGGNNGGHGAPMLSDLFWKLFG